MMYVLVDKKVIARPKMDRRWCGDEVLHSSTSTHWFFSSASIVALVIHHSLPLIPCSPDFMTYEVPPCTK